MHTYIIQADDYGSLNYKVEEIKNKIANSSFSAYDLEEDDFYEVIDELKTISMFDEVKVVLAKNGEKLFQVNEKKAFELQKTLVDTSTENVLIIAIINDFIPNDLFNKVKRYSSFINLRVNNIPKDIYAKNEFARDNFNVLDDTINLLISYSADFEALKNNIELLKCYKWDSKHVSEEDIMFMITKPLDDNIYELINAYIARDKKRVFELYKDLLTINVSNSIIISSLISKLVEMYNVYILAKSHVSQEEIAKIYNVKSGRAYYMIKSISKISLNEIKYNLDELINLDYKIKSGKMDDSLGLELFLLK